MIAILLLVGCADSSISQDEYDALAAELAQTKAELAALRDSLTDPSDASAEIEEISLLFVQEATDGYLVANHDGTYTLVLEGVAPQTEYFSERPFLLAGSIPTDVFPDAFDWSFPPNAAVVPEASQASGSVLVIQLQSADFDPNTQAIRYTAQIIDSTGEPLQVFVAEGADAEVAYELGATSLFIDDLDYESLLGLAAPNVPADLPQDPMYDAFSKLQKRQSELEEELERLVAEFDEETDPVRRQQLQLEMTNVTFKLEETVQMTLALQSQMDEEAHQRLRSEI